MQSTVCIEPLSTVQRHFLFSPSSSFPWGQSLLKARMLREQLRATYKRTAMFRLLLL